MEVQKIQLLSAKYYDNKIKTNLKFYEKEKRELWII